MEKGTVVLSARALSARALSARALSARALTLKGREESGKPSFDQVVSAAFADGGSSI